MVTFNGIINLKKPLKVTLCKKKEKKFYKTFQFLAVYGRIYIRYVAVKSNLHAVMMQNSLQTIKYLLLLLNFLHISKFVKRQLLVVCPNECNEMQMCFFSSCYMAVNLASCMII